MIGNKNKVLVLLSIGLLHYSCEKLRKGDEQQLALINESDRSVVFCYSKPTGSNTIDFDDLSTIHTMKVVEKNQKKEFSPYQTKWETFFGLYPNNSVIMFIMSMDSVEKYRTLGVPFPRNEGDILKHNLINIDTLENRSWVLKYP